MLCESEAEIGEHRIPVAVDHTDHVAIEVTAVPLGGVLMERVRSVETQLVFSDPTRLFGRESPLDQQVRSVLQICVLHRQQILNHANRITAAKTALRSQRRGANTSAVSIGSQFEPLQTFPSISARYPSSVRMKPGRCSPPPVQSLKAYFAISFDSVCGRGMARHFSASISQKD